MRFCFSRDIGSVALGSLALGGFVLGSWTLDFSAAAQEPSPIFWDDRLSHDATPRPPKRQAAHISPWRTIVIPAPYDEPRSALGPPTRAQVLPPRPLTGYAHELGGIASYYWQAQMTSTGEHFDRRGFTAAHKTLPFGTRVRVTNLSNGKSTIVRINDRGPFKPGRVIDLSEAAAAEIAMTGIGLARVAIEVVR